MGHQLEVEWFNPDLFPNAPAERRGGWVSLYGGDSVADAQQAFVDAGEAGKVVRLTWRPR